MALKVDFSGNTKEIVVKPGVTDINVQTDLYSDWKEWVLTDDNAKYDAAFRTFGGDPTIVGQFAPRYYFLINDWKVIVGNNEDVTFELNLYTESETEPLFEVGSGSSVTNRNSDAVNVQSEIAESLDYNAHVQINTALGVTGTTYPIGTNYQPVNNMSDAITIAKERDIHELHIFGPVTFDVDLTNSYQIYGGNLRDEVDVQGVNLSGSTFRQCVVGGNILGSIALDNCLLKDGLSVCDVFAQHTGLQGVLDICDGSDVTMVDCFSQIPGNDSPSVFLGNDISFNNRRYSGGLSIYDCDTGTTVTLEYTAGNCRLLSGNTSGEIEIRGISKLTDQSSGTTVGTLGLIIPNQIATQHSNNVQTEILKNL